MVDSRRSCSGRGSRELDMLRLWDDGVDPYEVGRNILAGRWARPGDGDSPCEEVLKGILVRHTRGSCSCLGRPRGRNSRS